MMHAPFEIFGSPSWVRTSDLRINSPSLYRLSYRGIKTANFTEARLECQNFQNNTNVTKCKIRKIKLLKILSAAVRCTVELHFNRLFRLLQHQCRLTPTPIRLLCFMLHSRLPATSRPRLMRSAQALKTV